MNRAMRLAAALGINGDNSVGHLSTGEVVIPRGMMSPKLMAALQEAADETGTPLESFVVGSPTQQVNPHTGQPMFAGLGRGNGGRGGLGGRNDREGRGGQRDIGRHEERGLIDSGWNSNDSRVSEGRARDAREGGGGNNQTPIVQSVGYAPGMSLQENAISNADMANGLAPGGRGVDFGGGGTIDGGAKGVGTRAQFGAANFTSNALNDRFFDPRRTQVVPEEGTRRPIVNSHVTLGLSPSLIAAALGPGAGLIAKGVTALTDDPLSVDVPTGTIDPEDFIASLGNGSSFGDDGMENRDGGGGVTSGAAAPPAAAPAAPAAPTFTRPSVGRPPALLGLSSGMSPLQMRALLATYGTSGDNSLYRSDEAFDFYDQLLQNALINDDGTLGDLGSLLPIELQYLTQTRGFAPPSTTRGLLEAIAAT